jgi:hypothetical protein
LNRSFSSPGIAITSFAILLSGCGVTLVIGGVLMWMNGTLFAQSNDKLRPLRSPDGKLEAVIYRRTRGHGGGYTTDVTITKAGEKLPNRPGRVFIAEGEPAILIRWLDNTHLMVTDPEDSKTPLRAPQVEGITISDQ